LCHNEKPINSLRGNLGRASASFQEGGKEYLSKRFIGPSGNSGEGKSLLKGVWLGSARKGPDCHTS